MYECMHACMCVCVCVCTYVRLHVRMYASSARESRTYSSLSACIAQLQAAHLLVRVEAHDEVIAERARLPKRIVVPKMRQVVAPVDPDAHGSLPGARAALSDAWRGQQQHARAASEARECSPLLERGAQRRSLIHRTCANGLTRVRRTHGRERTCDRRGRRTPLDRRAPEALSSPARAPHPSAPAANSTLPDGAPPSRAHIQGSSGGAHGRCAPTAPMYTRPRRPDHTVSGTRGGAHAACGVRGCIRTWSQPRHLPPLVSPLAVPRSCSRPVGRTQKWHRSAAWRRAFCWARRS